MNLLLNLYLFILNYYEIQKKHNTELQTNIPLYINIIKNRTGYDLRTYSKEKLNRTILGYIKKKQILMLLESNTTSIFEKSLIIEELEKNNKYVSNIMEGGLYDDWNANF
jgi:hypothetical protein